MLGPKGCTSPYTNISQTLCSFGICWPTRRLCLTKSSQTLYSLEYVDPKFVPHQNKSNGLHWDMLIRMLYITKISQPWFSLRYVDPKVVPHQNQSTMVLIQVSWPEGYTSPKSAQHCVHWNMLTRRLSLIKISQALCSLGYVDPKALHQQNQLNIVFFEICSSEGGISSKSAKYCVHWDVVVRKKCFIYT